METALLNTDNISNIQFTGIAFIDDVAGVGEKMIHINIEHFDSFSFQPEAVMLGLNKKTLMGYMEKRNTELIETENFAELDHANQMLAMLEHDFPAIDKVKLFYQDDLGLTGEYEIATDDEDTVELESVSNEDAIILRIKLKGA